MKNTKTKICRIGTNATKCKEIDFVKKFSLNDNPSHALLRLQAGGVCGVFINGEFVEAHLGKLPNRVLALEVTSRLKKGENEIRFKMDGNYFECVENDMNALAGFYFTDLAAEIEIKTGKENLKLYTDKSFTVEAKEDLNLRVFGEISFDEYNRFWKKAAVWQENVDRKVNDTFTEFLGEEYKAFASAKVPTYAEPIRVMASNILPCDNSFSEIEKDIKENENYAVFDFGKLYVGYTVLEYEAKEDTEVELIYDYTENPGDFFGGKHDFFAACVRRLVLHVTLKKGETSRLVLKRRAAHFVMVKFPKESGLKLLGIKFKISMLPYKNRGWFSSEDGRLNKIWSVGKYTLDINRHQEYESCPRHEMKFFSGDGIMEALTDYYLSGEGELTDATLSIVDPAGATGIIENKLGRLNGLWDYPSWRIIMIYNYYRYFADKGALKFYLKEMSDIADWMYERLGSDNLVYQYPIYCEPFHNAFNATEYTGSEFRFGRKTYLNALFYKTFLCLYEIGRVLGDKRANGWKKTAEEIKTAINNTLWSDELGAYIDDHQPDYIPLEGNALAVLFGIADKQRRQKILETLKQNNWTEYGSTILSRKTPHTRGGNEMISPVMNTYEAEARFLNGDGEGVMEVIRRCWGSMVQKGAESYWEFAPNDETRWVIPAHGWASGCTYLIGAYVLGIKPLMPGFDKIVFAPSGTLLNFKGTVPTAKGDVAVISEAKDGGVNYSLLVPKGAKLKIELPVGCSISVTEY